MAYARDTSRHSAQGFEFTLQSVAQSRVSAKRAGLLCAISPTVAAQLGVIVLHEILGIRVVIGLILILISIALPHIKKN